MNNGYYDNNYNSQPDNNSTQNGYSDYPPQSFAPNLTIPDNIRFNDPLYLASCILISIACVSFDAILILIAVGMWFILLAAQKNKSVTATKGPGLICGSVYAGYIIGWIVAGALFLTFIAVLFCVVFSYDYIYDFKNNPFIYSNEIFNNIFNEISYKGMCIVLLFYALIASTATVLANVFLMRNLLAFVRNASNNLKTGAPVPNAMCIRKTFLIFGIISIVIASSFDIANFLKYATIGVALILLSIWVHKYYELQN